MNESCSTKNLSYFTKTRKELLFNPILWMMPQASFPKIKYKWRMMPTLPCNDLFICSIQLIALSDPRTQPWNIQFGMWFTSSFILYSSEIASTSLASNFTTMWRTPKSMPESLSNLLSFNPCWPECFLTPKNSTGPTPKSSSLSNSSVSLPYS